MGRNHLSLWMRWALVLVMASLLGCQPQSDNIDHTSQLPPQAALSDEAWVEDTLAWQQWRLARLLLPDGYLSLAALDFYSSGQWSVGSGDEAIVKVPDEPLIWGTLILMEDQQTAWFISEAESNIAVTHPHPDQANPPRPDAVRLSIAGGEFEPSRIGGEGAHFYVAVRKDQWAVRVRDPNSSARVGFEGLDYYPLDRAFQVVGRFEPHPAGTTMPTATVLGEILDEPNPGRVIFALAGKIFSLEAIAAASGDQFFFIFADRTSGKDTYGLGRFLYSSLPDEQGRVVLDFNRAYNPPCAFNAFTTCPLPPPQNRIDFPIEAGELTYRGVPGQDPAQLPVN